METLIYKIIYLVGFAATFIIRRPYLKSAGEAKVINDRKTPLDKILLFGAFFGINFVPMVYVFTPFLSFADYQLPSLAGIFGAIICVAMIWLFYLSHRDLGKNWSVNVQIRQDHQLITNGIYKYIRHPMYAAIWLMVIGQALLLQNFVAGLSGIVAFALFYFLRFPQEEGLMIEKFGDEYREYMKRTGRIFPKVI